MKQSLQSTFFSILAVTTMSIASCDIIDNPVVPIDGYNTELYGEPPVFDQITSSTKNVLVEDFTAHQCGNCPPAAEVAEAIGETHPTTVFPVAIHAGSLAATSNEYPTDWTCEEGNTFWDQLNFQANPLGRINRLGSLGAFYGYTEWEDIVTQELLEEANVGLQIETSWHPSASHLNVHVNGQWLNDAVGDYWLSILVLESHLHGDQLYYDNDPEHITDYEFNHLLRGSISGASGLVVSSDPVSGDDFQSDFTYNWNDEWLIENSSLVAVVSNADGYIVNCLGQYIIE